MSNFDDGEDCMELHRLRAVFADCRKPTKAQDEHMGLQKITLLILILVAVLWLPVGSTMAQIFLRQKFRLRVGQIHRFRRK